MYSPDLNSDDGIWQNFEQIELHHLGCQSGDESRSEPGRVTRCLQRMRQAIQVVPLRNLL